MDNNIKCDLTRELWVDAAQAFLDISPESIPECRQDLLPLIKVCARDDLWGECIWKVYKMIDSRYQELLKEYEDNLPF